jgi:hypothetical protein
VSERDIDVVLDQFDSVNERDFERAMGHYADDVVLIVPPAENAPEPGTKTKRVAPGGAPSHQRRRSGSGSATGSAPSGRIIASRSRRPGSSMTWSS